MLKLSVQDARSGEPSIGPLVFGSRWTWIPAVVKPISALFAGGKDDSGTSSTIELLSGRSVCHWISGYTVLFSRLPSSRRRPLPQSAGG